MPSEEAYGEAAEIVKRLIELASVFGFTQQEADALEVVLEQADMYEGLRY